ncbi:MAG TPA: NmrA family NAD(P)-binding protein [Polyangiales bacterium]
MYTVFGATGNTGKVVANQLLAQGKRVRAVVRDARKAEALRAQGAELRVADVWESAGLAQLLAGSEGAYVMLPPRADTPDLVETERLLTDALARALTAVRVPHVVLLSSMGAHLAEGTGPIATTRYAERVLSEATPALSALRPAYFMENWRTSLAGLPHDKLPSMLELDHAVPMIATEDIGRAAADVLLQGPKAAPVYELMGPRLYSPRDVARALSSVVGREIQPERVPNQAIVTALTGFGMSARNAELFRQLYAGLDSDHIAPQGGHPLLRGEVGIEQVLRDLLA